MITYRIYGRCTQSNRFLTHGIRAFHPSEATAILSVRMPHFEVIAVNS